MDSVVLLIIIRQVSIRNVTYLV